MSECEDVVVVGTQRAGAVTAMLPARLGYRVTVAERGRIPSDTLSTHGIARGGVVQLARWNRWTGYSPAGRPLIRTVKPRAGVDGYGLPGLLQRQMKTAALSRRHDMTATAIPVDNGVNVEALLGVRDALAGTPEIAQFQWRSTVSWVNGTHSRSDVETFYGFGDEQRHHTTFSYDVDHPLQFAAQDNGVTPVEYVLVALGGCLTAGVAAVAQQRSIQLRSVRATVAAEMDLHGILGADPDVRNGFSAVSVSYQIDADATAEEIRALVAQSQKRSAVYDILTNPTSVTVDVA